MFTILSPRNTSPVENKYSILRPSIIILVTQQHQQALIIGIPQFTQGLAYPITNPNKNPLYHGVNRKSKNLVKNLLSQQLQRIFGCRLSLRICCRPSLRIYSCRSWLRPWLRVLSCKPWLRVLCCKPWLRIVCCKPWLRTSCCMSEAEDLLFMIFCCRSLLSIFCCRHWLRTSCCRSWLKIICCRH